MPSKFLSDDDKGAVTRAPVRARVVDDGADLIDEDVAAKGGLTGIAIDGTVPY